MTMKSTPRSCSTAYTVTIFGWLSAEAALASLSSRRLDSASSGDAICKHLNRDSAIEHGVTGAVDYPHATFTEQCLYDIVRKGRADCESGGHHCFLGSRTRMYSVSPTHYKAERAFWGPRPLSAMNRLLGFSPILLDPRAEYEKSENAT